MSLDHVAFDQRCVTGLSADRDTVLSTEAFEVGLLGQSNFRAETLQVPDPLTAASSAGRLVYVEVHAVEVHTWLCGEWLRVAASTGSGDHRDEQGKSEPIEAHVLPPS
jgi:hypothetical protein